jgi:hypothetical protein
MTAPQEKAWGEQFATKLNNFPSLSYTIAAGIPADLSGLSATLENDTKLSAQFSAFCLAVEGRLNYWQHLYDDSQAELGEKTKLADQLSAALLQNLPGNDKNTPRRKTSDPDKFAGDEKDIAKRQGTYVNWRSQVFRIFAVDSHVFSSDFDKIQHLASLLTGEAYRLNRKRFDTITLNKTSPEEWHWATVEDVFEDLNAQYETLDLSQRAAQAFDNLYMTNKPYQNFIAEFNALADECGKSTAQKVEALQVKVSQELSDEMAHQIDQPSSSDFQKRSDMYQRIYNNMQNRQHWDKLRNARPGRQTGIPRNPQTPPTPRIQEQPAGDPMILDATGRGRISKQQCIDQHLCFYCKKPGHAIDGCEERKQANGKWGSPQPQPVRYPQPARPQNAPPQRPPPQQLAFPPAWRSQQPHARLYSPNPVHPAYARLRQLEPGYVLSDEISSTGSPAPLTPDGSSFDTPSPADQGKE